MKRLINYFGVFVVSLFLGLHFVSAKELMGQVFLKSGISRDNTCYNCINIFSETKEHTGFINLLYSQGISIGDYLNRFFNIGDTNYFNSSRKYNIILMTRNDFKHAKSIYGRQRYDKSFDKNVSYTSALDDYLNSPGHVHYLSGKSKDDVQYFIMFDNGSSTNLVGSSYTRSIFYLTDIRSDLKQYETDYMYVLDIEPQYIFYVDKAGNPIGYYARNVSSDSDNLYYSHHQFYFPFPKDNKPDMTQWYAYTYYTGAVKFNSGHVWDKIFTNYFVLEDGTEVTTANNAGYSALANFFINLVDSYQYNFTNYNLDFIYDDVFYKRNYTFTSTLEHWYKTGSLTLPSNYEYIALSDYQRGYYVVPKSGCSSADYNFYFNGDSNQSRHKLYFTYYKKNSDKQLEYVNSFYVFSNYSYMNYAYNPFSDLKITKDEYLDYTINVSQSNNVINFYLYYNPKCYNKVSVTENGLSGSIPFADGTQVTLSKVESDNNWTSHNNTNANSTNNSQNSQGSNNPNVTENNDPWTGGGSGSLNLGSITANIGNYANSFYTSIVSLVGLTGKFLTNLPSEIYSVLISIFTIGLIILVIKLFL